MNSFLRWMLVASVVATAAACGGEASDGAGDEALGEGEDELRSRLVPGAVAVEIKIVPMRAASAAEAAEVTVAAPSKVRKVLASIKTRPAGTPVPSCLPAARTELRFLDEKGKEVGSVDTSCGGFGQLKKGDTTTPVRTNLDYAALAAERLVPGDALWGITAVEINQVRAQSRKTITDAETVAKLVRAVDAEQPIDGDRPTPSCLPTYAIGFKRGSKVVAHTSFICGRHESAPPRELTAAFTISGATEDADTLVSGAVRIEPRPFLAALED